MKTLKEFFESIVIEELHPELRQIAMDPSPNKKKQTAVSQKIRELTARGEPTGIEGNMPKGSSRAYLKHADPEDVTIDGKPTQMRTGLKIAVRSRLDPYHSRRVYGDLPLGNLQNQQENDDHYVNTHYRVLTKTGPNQFESNDEGVLPPLLDHDEKNHEWAHVGHAETITKKQFKELTKTPEFPSGVSHDDFVTALERTHLISQGKWYGRDEDKENYLRDLVNHHPIVQKFYNYHEETGHPPDDLRQIENFGVWTHPVTGKKHLVARDSGYTATVMSAYRDARINESQYRKAQVGMGVPWNKVRPKKMT